jgi:ParB-like chromosome segregation protein Spo0J
MALNLGQVLSQSGPTLGTQRESSRYIDIDCLVADERNFYELSGIDALAANIELIGLQQPIRVRELSGNPGKFRIVSGHRRRAAIQKLVDEGREDLRSVHCIVETVECSEAMQELRLIYANSDTRKMSSADLSRQAERVEALLYQLKEEGFEFPGRMRDHVAQACQTTKSKLSRLKVIRENLHPTLRSEWEEGRVNDAVAYRIAKEDKRIQNQLFSNTGYAARHWTEEAADAAIGRVKNPPTRNAVPSNSNSSQKAVNDYLEQRAAEDVDFVRFIQQHGFESFLKQAAGITRQAGIKEMKDRIGFSHRSHFNGPDDRWDAMPNGLTFKGIGQNFRRSWTEVWDAMAVEALRRCRLEQIRQEDPKPEPVGQLVFNGWMPGGTNPATPCDAVVVFELGDRPVKRICKWNGKDWVFENGGVKIEMDPMKWMILPPDEEDA